MKWVLASLYPRVTDHLLSRLIRSAKLTNSASHSPSTGSPPNCPGTRHTTTPGRKDVSALHLKWTYQLSFPGQEAGEWEAMQREEKRTGKEKDHTPHQTTNLLRPTQCTRPPYGTPHRYYVTQFSPPSGMVSHHPAPSVRSSHRGRKNAPLTTC